MANTRRIIPTLTGMVAVGAFTLSGCTSSQGTQSSESKSSASPTSSPSASAATSTPQPSNSPSASSTPTTKAVGECTSDQLTASLGSGGGSGAGHQNPTVILTNSGNEDCTISGYPGVSFVGDNNGTQLGAPAERDSSGPAAQTITLKPGDAAHANLNITEAANYSTEDCSPTPADGLRVYPPDETAAMFIQDSSFTACANENTVIITVQAFQPGAE